MINTPALLAAEKAYREHIDGRPMVNAIEAYKAVLKLEASENEDIIKNEIARHSQEIVRLADLIYFMMTGRDSR